MVFAAYFSDRLCFLFGQLMSKVTKGKLLMRKYWSKVGLNKYSKKHNILWTDQWSMPDWLREKIFSD